MLVICNIKDEFVTDHCRQKCLHGRTHEKDECTSLEFCDIVNRKIKCRKLYKKELKYLNGK